MDPVSINPPEILKSIAALIQALRGQSRIQKLAGLTEILSKLEEIEVQTGRVHLKAAFTALCKAVEEQIVLIGEKTKRKRTRLPPQF